MKIAWLFASTILLLPGGIAGAGEVQHELLVFGSAEVARTTGADESATDVDEQKIAADVLFSLQHNSFKVFGEYLLTNHESDLERFQVGWEPSERSVVWLGRFHQASSVWNHEHHHGQFLQTSIARPASEEWEDEGGIIPQHFVGALWESSWRTGSDYQLHTAFGGGIAPVITDEGLEPFDLLKPDSSRHKLGAQARIAYLPHELEDTGVGLLFAHNEIATRDFHSATVTAFDHIDQTVIGAYARYESPDWKLAVTGYRVTTWFDGAGADSRHQNFFAGYAQVERDLSHGVELFARHENTVHASESRYLQMFPRFVSRRTTLGARWQFARSHALTLEISDAKSRTRDYGEFRLQWSAALL
jgi:hypothetical protein